MLQQDMLAYADETAPAPTLVLGAGVQREWLGRPMTVTGVWTRLGRVDWSWRDGKMTARVVGDKCAVRPGPAFAPKGAPEVEFVPPR
jgi:hypothetical protein